MQAQLAENLLHGIECLKFDHPEQRIMQAADADVALAGRDGTLWRQPNDEMT